MQIHANTIKYLLYECDTDMLVCDTDMSVSCQYHIHVFLCTYVQIHQFVFDKNTCRIRTNRITDELDSALDAHLSVVKVTELKR